MRKHYANLKPFGGIIAVLWRLAYGDHKPIVKPGRERALSLQNNG